jgi:hypothetical protein
MWRHLIFLTVLALPSLASAHSEPPNLPSSSRLMVDTGSPTARNRAVLEGLRAIVRRFVDQLDEVDPIG